MPATAMFTLAIVHLDTSLGPFRVTVSEAYDGTLIAERIGAQEPYGYRQRVGELLPTDAGRDDDATWLVSLAVEEIQSYGGEISAMRQVRHA